MEEEPTIEDVTFELPPKEVLPPQEEATAVFFPEDREILIAGVFIDGSSNETAALKEIDVVEDSLYVKIHEVEKENSGVVMGSERPIAYEIYVDFDTRIPHEVAVEHYSRIDEVQYEREITYYQ